MVNLELGTVDNGKSMFRNPKRCLRCKRIFSEGVCKKDGVDTAEFFSEIKEELFHSRRVEEHGV